MISVFVPLAVVAASIAFALRPELANTWLMWLGLIVPYSALGVWALWDLKRRDLLRERLRPRGGDISLGIALGLALVAAGVLAQRYVAPPGEPTRVWLFSLYLQLGDLQNSVVHLFLAALLGVAEELVWRGLVLESLRERWGARVAAPASALAWGLAHSPSLSTLGDAQAGLNPLLVLASLGCGVCWAFGVLLLGRLWPMILSHWVFVYFMAGPLPAWL